MVVVLVEGMIVFSVMIEVSNFNVVGMRIFFFILVLVFELLWSMLYCLLCGDIFEGVLWLFIDRVVL